MIDTINIKYNPTFDLKDFEILSLSEDMLFCKTKNIFRFDLCVGTIMPRSRTLRPEKQESTLVKQVIGGVIDSGFTGHLMFKVQLTKEGIKEYKSQTPELFFLSIKEIAQLFLQPCSYNYYQAGHSNFNPDLDEDYLFTSITTTVEQEIEISKLN